MTYLPFLDVLSISQILFAFCITVVAGFVKGATGFAMPMIMISGLGSFLSPEVAVAALIVPTVVTNVFQAFRGGVADAFQAAKDFRLYIVALLAIIAVAAKLVVTLDQNTVFLALGFTVIFFAGLLLSGVKFKLSDRNRAIYDLGFGAVSGVIGGISGIWGPLTVAYLTALDTPKKEQIMVSGVIFGLGAVTLFLAHLRSGVLNRETLPLSAALLVPSLLGLFLGQIVQDRLDQKKFRRATLVVLLIAGANLIRRGWL